MSLKQFILLYVCQSWTLTAETERQIHIFEFIYYFLSLNLRIYQLPAHGVENTNKCLLEMM